MLKIQCESQTNEIVANGQWPYANKKEMLTHLFLAVTPTGFKPVTF